MMRFVGYGVENPKIVFIGIEEWARDGTNYTEFAKDFDGRAPVIDLHANKNTKGFVGADAKKQKTWWPICQFLVGIENGGSLEGVKDCDFLNFQALRLGRANGNHLLTELFPVSKTKSSRWPESCSSFFKFPSLGEYHRSVWPSRSAILKQKIFPNNSSRPEIVCCYGKSHWQKFAELVGFEGELKRDANYMAVECQGMKVFFTHHPNSQSRHRLGTAIVTEMLKAL